MDVDKCLLTLDLVTGVGSADFWSCLLNQNLRCILQLRSLFLFFYIELVPIMIVHFDLVLHMPVAPLLPTSLQSKWTTSHPSYSLQYLLTPTLHEPLLRSKLAPVYPTERLLTLTWQMLLSCRELNSTCLISITLRHGGAVRTKLSQRA